MVTVNQSGTSIVIGLGKASRIIGLMLPRTPATLMSILFGLAVISAPGQAAVPGLMGVVGEQEHSALLLELDRLTVTLARLSERVERLESELTVPVAGQLPLPSVFAGKVIDVSDLPRLGQSNTAIAIIEVTDYECPFCRSHFNEVYPLIRRDLVETGTVSYFIMDYPLPGHDLAVLAAEAAQCAAEQGAFRDYHEHLFSELVPADERAATSMAESLGLDAGGFAECLSRLRMDQYITRQRALALGLGVKGTPTFFVGRLGPDRIVRDITVLHGIQTATAFQQTVARYQPQ